MWDEKKGSDLSDMGELVTFDLFARILAGVAVQGRNDVYEQRIEFMKIEPEERDKIIKFIFEIPQEVSEIIFEFEREVVHSFKTRLTNSLYFVGFNFFAFSNKAIITFL